VLHFGREPRKREGRGGGVEWVIIVQTEGGREGGRKGGRQAGRQGGRVGERESEKVGGSEDGGEGGVLWAIIREHILQ